MNPTTTKAVPLLITHFIMCLSLLIIPGTVFAEDKKAERTESKQYKLITRPPIRSLPLYEVEQTHILSNQAIIVQSGPSRGYLLTLKEPCEGLQVDGVISITNTVGSIEAGFDSVIEGLTRRYCLIDKIYPLATPEEIKKAQAEEEASKAAAKK